MARLQIFFPIMIVLCLTTLKSPALAQVTDSESQPPTSTPTELEICAESLSERCGDEIFSDALEQAAESNVSKECCVELVEMGYGCHHMLLIHLLEVPEFQPYVQRALPKIDVTWTHCQDLAAGL